MESGQKQMLVEETNRCQSWNAQEVFGALPLNQLGTKEAVRDVLVMIVVRIKKYSVLCTVGSPMCWLLCDPAERAH